MCFDVLKVVWSPGYDHGHDEESRNGRDIKIDILDDYIWTSDRVSSGIYRSTGRLPKPPGRYMGLIGPYWERGEGSLGGGAPKPNPNWVGDRPPFLPPLSPFLPFLVQLGKGGILLPVGVGLPMGRAIGGGTLEQSYSYPE